MFSADSAGLIIVWKMPVTNDQQLDPCHQWCIDMVHDLTMLDYTLYILCSFHCVLTRRCSKTCIS